MKWKFTHKELTLLLGILVAVIIIITLWMQPFSFQSREAADKPIRKIATSAANALVKKAYVLVSESVQ